MNSIVKHVAVILGGSLALSTFAIAEEGSTGRPNTKLEPFGDWALRCQHLPGALPCDIVHHVSHRDSRTRVLGFSIVYSPESDNYAAQIIVPLGVNLRRGIDIAVGDVLAQSVRVNRCELTGCFIEALLAPDMVDAFAKNDQGSITFSGDGKNDTTIKFSLVGFSAARTALTEKLEAAEGVGSEL